MCACLLLLLLSLKYPINSFRATIVTVAILSFKFISNKSCLRSTTSEFVHIILSSTFYAWVTEVIVVTYFRVNILQFVVCIGGTF